ncbi:DNA-directed RNA polymerase sigma-70 factor [Adhaeribacter aerolatus]|uniref:DNA-directed RNA polymerase sigma-70 factor n=1 Tax=Adhaeribacter aerolatus TaxID=670289 RepID=A0A512B5U7_9BACT|nr:sigma-70 family RNA polymerase sigma factor [Adhaeribacter aerolatus]GEO07340.1 DNA-directed RNA polymerase sigma-70 factor [Adhaeribacter aerolatus]
MKYGELDDNYLLQRLADGDGTAFREIYLRYWQRLYTVAFRKTKCRETAEEVVQQIFVRLWEMRAGTTIENLSGYLHTAVKYSIIALYREKLSDARYQEHAKVFQNQYDRSTEKEIALQDLVQAINSGVEQMPAKTQQIFSLNRLENQSVTQISESLKLPSRTIEYHITQGMRLLKLHLKDFVSFSLAALSLLV